MKRPFLPNALTIMWLALGAASAQTDCSFGPVWSHSIQTTGGITYFVYSASLDSCKATHINPITASGTNLSCSAALVPRTESCPDICLDPPCCYGETAATVLGNLASDNYRLIIYGNPTWPWTTTVHDFQVPESSGSTLTVTAEADKTRIAVSGVPAAFYVLETSTNLLDWTSVNTNQGAPCTFTNSTSAAPSQFFRVQVRSGRKNN